MELSYKINFIISYAKWVCHYIFLKVLNHKEKENERKN